MDLDSWTPTDKARRLAIAVAVQIAIFVFVLVWLALAWPWYLVVVAPVLTYLALFYPLFACLRRRWRA